MEKIYAKWDPHTEKSETLKEHTHNVIANVHLLKKAYPSLLSTELWEILESAALYHDMGKVYEGFQQTLQSYMGLIKITKQQIEKEYPYIPHGFLSLLFVPFSEMKLSTENNRVLQESIAYHHERNVEIDWSFINQLIKLDLQEKVNSLKKEMGCPIRELLGTRRLLGKRIGKENNEYISLVLVKGLLNRVDHAASAGEIVEYHVDKGVGMFVAAFLRRNGHNPRELQLFSYENRNNNIIAVAQTGMGKTEAALFWINESKGFITLPIRVSLNALYDRVANAVGYVDEQNQPISGLLHSGSMEFLQMLSNDYENNEIAYEQSRLLSRKLTFCTIDQILKFPFLFRGYEKYLATMSYSKLVLDEIQGYSPKILAVILKALEMVHQVGGKFMIMTATLPTVFLEEMEKRGYISIEDFKKAEFSDDSIRHRVCIRKTKIDKDLEFIREEGRKKRILIISNTVKEAKRLYNLLRTENSRLLHTQFIRADRTVLEEAIKDFAPNTEKREEKCGVWIATQLVEASLDIDFDLLFTEISTLDSFFQRLGRCYRGREYNESRPNVFVYTDAEGVGTVYDQSIINYGLELLHPFNGQILKEKTKMELVEILYRTENLSKQYLDEFRNALEVLDNLQLNDMGSKEAQNLLRDIDNYQVIPHSVYYEHQALFSAFKQEKIMKDRKLLRMRIEKLTLSISKNQVRHKKLNVKQLDIPGLQYLYIID